MAGPDDATPSPQKLPIHPPSHPMPVMKALSPKGGWYHAYIQRSEVQTGGHGNSASPIACVAMMKACLPRPRRHTSRGDGCKGVSKPKKKKRSK